MITAAAPTTSPFIFVETSDPPLPVRKNINSPEKQSRVDLSTAPLPPFLGVLVQVSIYLHPTKNKEFFYFDLSKLDNSKSIKTPLLDAR